MTRRPLVVYADGPDGPLPDPRSVAAVRELADPELLLGWVVRTPGWLDETGLPVTTVLAGSGLRAAVRTGRVRHVPRRLSAMPALLRGGLRPDVAVVGAVAEGGGWRSIASVGWAPAAARVAREVVIEQWPAPPAAEAPTAPAPAIEGNVVEVLLRADPPDPPQVVVVGERERRIAAAVAGLLPDGATLQWGPGALGAAVVAALTRPVRVHAGVVTDELVGLAERGLLAEPAVAAYLWGGPGLARLAAAGAVRLESVEHTHDPARLAAIPRFVAVNTALEVGLDGAANVEGPRDRPVSGPGGHPDFCLGASRSTGGLSVVVLRAEVAGRSAIVGRPAVISTPRTDVGVVVTEHGVADLRGRTDAERAASLIAVAGPAHRRGLRLAAATGG